MVYIFGGMYIDGRRGPCRVSA